MKAIFKIEGTIELELNKEAHNQMAIMTKDAKKKWLEKHLKHVLEMCEIAADNELSYQIDLSKLKVVENSEIEFKK